MDQSTKDLSEEVGIGLAEPCLQGNEWFYIRQCLETGWISYRGSFVDRFESALAERVGATFAVTTNSGTAALHTALLISGVEVDTEVLMPAMTFVAPANCVRYCGAWPVFTDLNPCDWQWDLAQVAGFLECDCRIINGAVTNSRTGRRISALLAVHLFGGMCDVEALAMLANKYGLPVIEDAAQSLGATWNGRSLGKNASMIQANRRIITTSFNANKIVTTGGGGALLLNDADLASKARHITTTAKVAGLEFFHDQVGFNYRMTNVAAAMGVAQLEQLDSFLIKKRLNALKYEEQLSNIPHQSVASSEGATRWLFTILLNQTSRQLIEELNSNGVSARPAWTPLYRLPAFQAPLAKRCPFTDYFYDRAISLPSSVQLTADEIGRVVSQLTRALGRVEGVGQG